MTRHLLVLIHGITTDEQPQVTAQYGRLVQAVKQANLPLSGPICQVHWGFPAPGQGAERPDQYLSLAEAVVGRRLREDRPDGEQQRMPGGSSFDVGIWPLRQSIEHIRRSVVQLGLSDAIYYTSSEGEQAVRNSVFEQVFSGLGDQVGGGPVVMHIVAHSLGVTVAHDFLYALFGRKYDEDYPQKGVTPDPHPLHDRNQAREEHWRGEAEAGRLKLGTFISFASQLPLFVLRKQALVKRIANGERLDPRVIGVDPTRDSLQWAILYDADDPLGFRTRALYESTPAIADIRVGSGLGPQSAHLGYWLQSDIVDRCVAMLKANIA